MTQETGKESTTSPDPGVPVAAPNAVALTQEFDLDGLYVLRESVAAHAIDLGLPKHRLGPLVLVATELATNAIRYGGGTGTLRLWRAGDTLYVQVRDEGPGLDRPEAAGTRLASLAADGGRGLWIVRTLGDRTDIAVDRGTAVTVAFDFDLDGSSGRQQPARAAAG
jgi:anti-sigma regulatory factor (Ser/Thr protein kinase)